MSFRKPMSVRAQDCAGTIVRTTPSRNVRGMKVDQCIGFYAPVNSFDPGKIFEEGSRERETGSGNDYDV